MSSGWGGCTCGPLVMRMRSVRGETNSMENGSVGLAAYWFSGNSFGSDRLDDGQVVVERVRTEYCARW
jgi:hypothetical protein